MGPFVAVLVMETGVLTADLFSSDLFQLSELQPPSGDPRGGPFRADQLGGQQRVLHAASACARRRLKQNAHLGFGGGPPDKNGPHSFGFHNGYFVFLRLKSYSRVVDTPLYSCLYEHTLVADDFCHQLPSSCICSR